MTERTKRNSVTVVEAAVAIGKSVRTVQLDIRAGCDGIVSLGKPGRGNGALLDQEVYARWRERSPGTEVLQVQERERIWKLLCEAAASTLKDSGGVSVQNRQLTAKFTRMLLDRFHQASFRRLPEFTSELRSIFRVYLD